MTSRRPLRDVLLADASVNWSHRGRSARPASWADVLRTATDIRFLPVVLVRLSAAAGSSRATIVRMIGKVVSLINRQVFGVECAPQTQIGPGLYFPHVGGIVIGAERIGARCTIYHQVTLGAQSIDMPFTPGLRPIVGDDVVLGAGAKVLGGVTVGDHAAVGANAVVVHDVSPRTVVGGIPAVPIKKVTT
jgi:serine O-acetyltransferase